MYVAYARALNNLGNTNDALEILNEANSWFLNKELLLEEYYNIYDSIGDWDQALKIAKKLININSENSTYHFNCGRVFAIMKNNRKAQEMYLEGLKIEHQLSFTELTNKIKIDFTSTPNKFSTEYLFVSGSNNFGAFLHKWGNKQYFTKISKYNRGSKREVIFYKKIQSEYESLKAITPKYISSKKIGRIHYITIETLNGSDVDLKNENLKKVIDVAQQIAKVDYTEINNKFPNPDYAFRMRNRPNSILIYFTKIHEQQYNEKMFSSLYKLMNQSGYSQSIKSVIKRVEKQIMDNNLYVFINPYKHYSLLHGDFIQKNLKLECDSDSIKVFDWTSFTLGPHFINIARYLTSALIPYDQIKKDYLFNEKYDETLTDIEKIFFLYALIPFYILRVKENKADQYLNSYILPAVEDLEILVSKFMERNLKGVLDLLTQKEYMYISEIDELKNVNKKAKKENKELLNYNKELERNKRAIFNEKNKVKKQYENTVNSKSWKLTYPFRKFTELLKTLLTFKH